MPAGRGRTITTFGQAFTPLGVSHGLAFIFAGIVDLYLADRTLDLALDSRSLDLKLTARTLDLELGSKT